MKPLPEADLQEIASRCADVFRELDGAHVLITGHTGFVGSWLFASLARAIDAANLNTVLTGTSRSGGAFTMSPKRAPVGDACGWTTAHGSDVRKLTMHPQTTHVIHCANAGSHAENVDDPHKVAGMIVDGTKRVVAECERVGVKRLLLLSSGSVYVPKHDGTPYRETDPVQDQPVTLFGYAKRCAERWALASNVPTVSARGFAMLGPRLPAQFAASEFMACALAGKPIHVKSPDTVRSYLYASDMAAWLWTLLVRGETGTAYNVGSDSPLTVAALARLVATRADTPVSHAEYWRGDMFVPDIRRMASLCLSGPFVGITPPGDAIDRWMAWERGA